jgi:3'5'-cyclic nucleotide phosphodiesterase/Adenylate and Guanylate cyclase catalytic domain
VLRGSKGRFQLFGDTVNTAARMESHSLPGKVLCTQKTADLLIAAGKQHWLKERDGMVGVKGKGSMKCYWCRARSDDRGLHHSASRHEPSPPRLHEVATSNTERLVDWVANLFEDAIENIEINLPNPNDFASGKKVEFSLPRSEVSETIVMNSHCMKDNDETSKGMVKSLSEMIKKQLKEYISLISMSYRNNSFHNFEHACHVIMATKKLLLRVIKPIETSASATSYGLTTDPLVHFGILMSALIHDVDHPGVSNGQLVKEKDEMAIRYNNQSVAEQNSVALAWDLLMQPKFVDLRSVIAPSHSDLARLRQVLVNSVIATDLFDSDLQSFRENRWKKAFDTLSKSDDHQSNLRAAIVIEHIIQASDVSHTMQHWHVYQKWNH